MITFCCLNLAANVLTGAAIGLRSFFLITGPMVYDAVFLPLYNAHTILWMNTGSDMYPPFSTTSSTFFMRLSGGTNRKLWRRMSD